MSFQSVYKQKGVIVIMALVFLAVFFTVSTGMVAYSTQLARSENYATASAQAFNLAEAGIDKAITELNLSSSYTGESNTSLGQGTFTTTVTSVDSSTKTITSTGYIPNSGSPIATKTVKTNVNIGNSVISFRYGVQAGNGGFVMNGGSTVNGTIYSNGNIVATNGVRITGAAVAANQPATSTDQTNNTPSSISSCTSSNCVTFGNNSSTEDFAQSFQISSSIALNSIQFYVKKVGTPSDATVRIVTNNGGSPSTNVLMTGTLSASSVSTNFGWVTVTMPSTPVLNADETYWMVIDASSNASRYYIIGANSNGYANGQAKIGRYSSSSWSFTSPSGLDGYFQILLGGGTSYIGGDNYVGGVNIGSSASDEAWAHTVKGASVSGTIYCQTGTSNNKTCNTSRADPTPQAMPLTDTQIQDWKDDAATGGTITGDYHVNWAGGTLGPKVITGNLLVDGGGTLTVSGTLYVQGNITITGGGQVRLASSFGTNSGAIVTDGVVNLNGGANFSGSGQSGSYPFLITTSSCPASSSCGGADAITLSGGAGTVALIAQDGEVTINGGSALKQVTANQITMSGGATLYYDSGLISENFSSGPGGSWQVVPGTYAITN